LRGNLKEGTGSDETLEGSNRWVNHLQQWASKYQDALQHLEKKDNIVTGMDRDQLRLHQQNYMRPREQSTSTVVAYNQLQNGFESLTQNNGMPLIGTLEAIRGRDIIFLEIRQYIKQIKQETEQEGLVTKEIIL